MKITSIVPWLVKFEGTGWGEYLFVEVRTDEGRHRLGRDHHHHQGRQPRGRRHPAPAQRPDRRRRPDPHRADLAQDLPLLHLHGHTGRHQPCDQRHRHRAVGHPRQDAAACRSTSCWAARCATTSCSTPIPTNATSPTSEGVVEEIRAIVDSGHTGIKFDPFPSSRATPASGTAISTASSARRASARRPSSRR